MYRRDLALAVASGAVLVVLLWVLDALHLLGDPRAIVVGVGVGVVVEAAFLAGTRVTAWWDRPWVALASALGVVVLGAGLAVWVGPVTIAAACWGLATYVVALALSIGIGRARTRE